MSDDAATLLESLIEGAPELTGSARWTSLLVEALRAQRKERETGLAEGELRDGLYLGDEGVFAQATPSLARPLAAATPSSPPSRASYRAGTVEVVLAINPEGGGFALIRGLEAARLELSNPVALQAGQWSKIAADWRGGFPEQLTVTRPDGQSLVLARFIADD